MRTPVPAIVYRPTRSAPATLLALLLLIVGGLGTWLTAYRFLKGVWPQRAVTTLDAVGAASLGSIAVLVAAGSRRRLWSLPPDRSTVAWPPPSTSHFFPTISPGRQHFTVLTWRSS